ncbi:hypothetical protein D3OALGA1CA_3237 [Olavius algarvensis associated proteobacterium Delta 3]|nr:hypothetical protein D3OALGB2SA_1865 [Olavius algarvensis associated proteobacterium Delta 3]CAB5131167.1 hypothetical protein D3OALGA1CA_3237 [Olavius algarvensis associated proteobacterium Delta 3]
MITHLLWGVKVYPTWLQIFSSFMGIARIPFRSQTCGSGLPFIGTF